MESPDTFDIVGVVRELLSQHRRNVYYQTKAAMDRIVLKEVLDYVKGIQVEAAEILGISRNTLRARLRRLGLVVEKQVSLAPAGNGSEKAPGITDMESHMK